jgi:hypothetical protein
LLDAGRADFRGWILCLAREVCLIFLLVTLSQGRYTMSRCIRWKSVLAVLGLLGFAVVDSDNVANAATVTLPYSEDFSGASSSFTTAVGTGTVAWADNGGIDTLRLTQTSQAGSQSNSASVSVTSGLGAGDLAPTDYFLISTTVKYDTSTTTGSNGIDVGLNIFGDAAFGTTYRADFNPTKNKFRLVTAGGSGFTASDADKDITFSTAETYTLAVKGWYTGGTLNLEFYFTDPSEGIQMISATHTSPHTGQFFGIRARTGSSVTATNTVAHFDDFSISVVPEPSAIVLVMLSLISAGMIGLRRNAKVAA